MFSLQAVSATSLSSTVIAAPVRVATDKNDVNDSRLLDSSQGLSKDVLNAANKVSRAHAEVIQRQMKIIQMKANATTNETAAELS